MEKNKDSEVKNIVPNEDQYEAEIEAASMERISEAIKEWYSITQSSMKILMQLKRDHKLDNNQLRAFNSAVKRFGWSSSGTEFDLVEKELEDSSPYNVLSVEYEVGNMASKRTKRFIDAAIKSFDKYFEEKEPKEIPVSRLNESGDIGEIYKELEFINERAAEDIQDVEALKKRKDKLCSDLREVSPAFKNTRYREQFVKEFIDRAIAIGYTAGINANTTDILRKSKSNNSSNNRKEA